MLLKKVRFTSKFEINIDDSSSFAKIRPLINNKLKGQTGGRVSLENARMAKELVFAMALCNNVTPVHEANG